MHFSKSHFINEIKKTNDSIDESVHIINEAKGLYHTDKKDAEVLNNIDTIADFSVGVNVLTKQLLPNLKRLDSKTMKSFEKILGKFQEDLEDLMEKTT